MSSKSINKTYDYNLIKKVEDIGFLDVSEQDFLIAKSKLWHCDVNYGFYLASEQYISKFADGLVGDLQFHPPSDKIYRSKKYKFDSKYKEPLKFHSF